MKQFLGFLILFALVAFKPTEPTKLDLLKAKYAPLAQKYQKEYGVPASIQLAQAFVESHYGTSPLAIHTNNHFGITKGDDWDGDCTIAEAGKLFRCYDSDTASWEDHAKFLHKHYPTAMGQHWKLWAKNCRGYGGPDYWYQIGQIIQRQKLYEYDRLD